MYQRGGSIVAKTVTDTRAKTLSPLIEKHISNGSKVFTDGWDYGGLNEKYEQHSVDHGIGFYGTTIVDDDGVITNVCTNGIECAWSQLKRTILGTYYRVSKKYLQRYVDEFVFRFNTRKLGDNERFELFLRNVA